MLDACRSESDVKSAIKKLLEAAGAWFFMPVSGGWGKHGIPDFIVCHKGRFMVVEAKYGGNTTTLIQRMVLKAVAEAGGVALIINETNLHVLYDELRKEVCIPAK